MKTKKYIIIKSIFLSICTLIYLLDFFFYGVFSSAVDPGFKENPIGDLVTLVVMGVIKFGTVFLYLSILKKLKVSSVNSSIYLLALTFGYTGFMIQWVFHERSLINLKSLVILLVNFIIIFRLVAALYKYKKELKVAR
ncbi:hypothetical protein CSC2_03530 [Clostridium zeae]|uniref:Uncharacterized protein n=1 Tax=Clostridium zeae TaxID=2759022 RepID=A0ABQ1E510_9CLOT|nr:hypothetical protein [Clostridium zeae]GFZ29827.1 hypothetical protein CSC2_03530 [Clostridium zeae]